MLYYFFDSEPIQPEKHNAQFPNRAKYRLAYLDNVTLKKARMPANLKKSDSSVSLWLKLLAPVLFSFAFVHYFQIQIRGGSTTLEFFHIASIAAAIGSTSLLHRIIAGRAGKMHEIVDTAIRCTVFFTTWALTTVVAEEIYIYTDVYKERRIYADDSGEGYAVGLKGTPAFICLFTGFGIIFGFVWGGLIWMMHKALAKAKLKQEP